MQVTNFYKQILGIEDPWEISKVEIDPKDKSVHIYLSHPIKSKFPCKKCGSLCSVHDHSKDRIWRHLDTCDHYTYLKGALPRLACKDCGVNTVVPSWSRPNSSFTLQFESYAIDVLQLNQVRSKTALQLRISDEQLKRIQNQAVERGLQIRKEGSLTHRVNHICIDEKSLFKGHHYVTILYDGTTGSVLEVVEDRTEESANQAFTQLEDCLDLQKVKVVSMDMWKAFTNSSKKIVPQADIVYDRFHLAKYLNNAVDITRRAENKQLLAQQDDGLKKTKYLWLKNPENFTEYQQMIHNELLENKELKTVKAWKLKEKFKQFFKLEEKQEARSFFKEWVEQIKQVDNKHLLKVANTFEKHLEGLINYIKHKVSNAMAESVNMTIQQIKVNARGFKSAKAFRVAILFHLGGFNLYP